MGRGDVIRDRSILEDVRKSSRVVECCVAHAIRHYAHVPGHRPLGRWV